MRRFQTRYGRGTDVRDNPGSPFSSTTRRNRLKFNKHMHLLQGHNFPFMVDSCQMDGLARTGARGILRTTTTTRCCPLLPAGCLRKIPVSRSAEPLNGIS